jgi:methionine-rich copper-binding protein CopC
MYRIASIAILSSLVLGTVAAHAHAYLDRASPSVGSAVRSAPRVLSLWFSQNIESSFSTVTVTGPGGRVDLGNARVGSGNQLRVGLKPLGPGTYRVHWRVLSVDTHTTEGSFSFQVGR